MDEDFSQTDWSNDARILMRTARELSLELGHHEIVCPFHLLAGLLLDLHLESSPSVRLKRNHVLMAVAKYAPPWKNAVLFSPGGQTPTTKRVIVRAVELATQANRSVHVEGFWSALRECESDMVNQVMGRLKIDDVRVPL